MPGGKGIFPSLSVDDNLRLAGWLHRKDKAAYLAARDEVLQIFPILAERIEQPAANLSGGEQQMLALAQSFMTRPKLLMIDELSLGLAPAVVGQLLDIVEAIHQQGTTVVIVEQSVNVALDLAERAVFMEKGEVRFTGPTRDLAERPDLLRSVFIRHEAGAGTATPKRTRPRSLRAVRRPRVPGRDQALRRHPRRRRRRPRAPRRADPRPHRPERGGQDDAVRLHLRLPAPRGRDGLPAGSDITDESPHRRAARGLGRSFQEALLFPTLTTRETISVAFERHIASKEMVAAAMHLPASFEAELDIGERVEALIDLMGLGAFRDKLLGELSSGSRRIVELACILAQDPKVVLLDEPSAGVAQRETEALGPLLSRSPTWAAPSCSSSTTCRSSARSPTR